ALAAPLRKEGSGVRELLDTIVAGVCDEDMSAPIHGDAFGIEKLPVPAALAAPLGDEGAGKRLCIAHARAGVPARGLSADLPVGAAGQLGTRPAARGRLGNSARVVGADALAEILPRRLPADLPAGTRPAARGRLGTGARVRARAVAQEHAADAGASRPGGTRPAAQQTAPAAGRRGRRGGSRCAGLALGSGGDCS